MNENILNFVQCKRIAVVGVSRDPKKFGTAIYTELKKRGYQVYPVNPAMTELAGEPCYPNLQALNGKVDGAVICLQPSKVTALLQEAAQIGLHNLWLQQGSASPEVLKTAQDLGLNPVSKKCILMYAAPVQSFHGFHRFVTKLVGQL
ncbi:MAG: CoA-binding protein [Anaerolineaceae bacterium]|nr:CoA-binding protein [Anaerolineaceae bacterium]